MTCATSLWKIPAHGEASVQNTVPQTRRQTDGQGDRVSVRQTFHWARQCRVNAATAGSAARDRQRTRSGVKGPAGRRQSAELTWAALLMSTPCCRYWVRCNPGQRRTRCINRSTNGHADSIGRRRTLESAGQWTRLAWLAASPQWPQRKLFCDSAHTQLRCDRLPHFFVSSTLALTPPTVVVINHLRHHACLKLMNSSFVNRQWDLIFTKLHYWCRTRWRIQTSGCTCNFLFFYGQIRWFHFISCHSSAFLLIKPVEESRT